jgi:polyferredoxin
MTMKRSTLITLAVVAAIAALFFYMSTARANQECNVCMEFQGRTNCASAAGVTPAEATETAHRTACGPLVRGMNETIACDNRTPVSVQCRAR